MKDINDMIIAISNLVMAIGVVFAAWQVFVGQKNLKIQKNIRLTDLHVKFMRNIRSIQDRMPDDVNDWNKDFTDHDMRIVHLYWYALFDEWYVCKYKSSDKDVNSIWLDHIWGAKSAIDHLPAFCMEFVLFMCSDNYLLGTKRKFFDEISAFCIKNSPPKKGCAFLFGIPCSGKTTISTEIALEYGIKAISVDKIIKKITCAPSKNDFKKNSRKICLEIYRQVVSFTNEFPVVIEMGCLIEKKFTEALLTMLKLQNINVLCAHIYADAAQAKERALERNKKIADGTSQAIIIDEPELLQEFVDILNANMPNVDVVYNSTTSETKYIACSIIEKMKTL